MNAPKITVVMPTFNVAGFVEQAIDSVLSQGYPTVELIVMDGGSTDGTLDILKRNERFFHSLESGKDGGAHVAINRGFAKSTGDIMAFIGGDDYYLPRSLFTVSEAFSSSRDVKWITSKQSIIVNELGEVVHCNRRAGTSRASFFDGCHTEGIFGYAGGFLQAEGIFWRRELWEATGGGLREDKPLANDFDLWLRFFHVADIHNIDRPLAAFRLRSGQKSRESYQALIAEAKALLEDANRRNGHVIAPTPAIGYREYAEHCVMNGAVYKRPYLYIDIDGKFADVKKLLISNLIG